MATAAVMSLTPPAGGSVSNLPIFDVKQVKTLHLSLQGFCSDSYLCLFFPPLTTDDHERR